MITEYLKVWKNLIFNVNQDMTVAVCNCNLSNCKSSTSPIPAQNKKENLTYGLHVSAALLYQLKKEDPYKPVR